MNQRIDGILTFSLRRPRLALALALGLTLLFAGSLPGLRKDVRIEKIFPERDARRADYDELREVFGRDDETAFCVLELPGSVLEAPALARIHSLTTALEAHPLVDERRLISLSSAPLVRVPREGELDIGPLYEPRRREGWDAAEIDGMLRGHPAFANRLLSDDRRLASFLVPLVPTAEPLSQEAKTERRRRFAREVRAFWKANLRPGEQVHLDGFAITYDTVLGLLNKDVALFYPLAIALLLIALGCVFRRVLATVLCVGTMIATVIWTLGSMALLGIPINWLSASCIPVMLLVVCVGDAVHLISRYHQQVGWGIPARSSLEHAVRDVGRACFFTSVTTAAGFSSLSLSQVEVVQELGIPTGLGVLYGYLITFLVVPPLLAWARPPQLGVRAGGDLLERPLAGLARFTARAPGRIVLASGVVFVGALALIPQVSLENRLLNDFDPDTEIMATRIFMEERLGGIAPLEVIVDGKQPGRIMEADAQRGVLSLCNALRAEPFRERGILFVLSLPDFLTDAYYTAVEERAPEFKGKLPDRVDALQQLRFLYSLGGEDDPTEPYADDADEPRRLRIQMRVKNLYTSEFFALVEAVRAEAERHLPGDVAIRITGNTLMSQAIHQSLVGDMARSFGLAFLLVGVLVLLFFRSVELALLGMLPNLLPLTLVLACMALAGVPLSVSTSIVFTVVFGISVDDTIHFVAALAQNEREGARPDPITATLQRTGLSLVLSSVVLVAGFAVLWLSNFKANRYFGLLASLTIVFALLADLVLLPALLWLRRGRLR